MGCQPGFHEASSISKFEDLGRLLTGDSVTPLKANFMHAAAELKGELKL